MRKLRTLILAAIMGLPLTLVTASPAGASCHLPKPGCTVYYTACAVAYEAGIQCVD